MKWNETKQRPKASKRNKTRKMVHLYLFFEKNSYLCTGIFIALSAPTNVPFRNPSKHCTLHAIQNPNRNRFVHVYLLSVFFCGRPQRWTKTGIDFEIRIFCTCTAQTQAQHTFILFRSSDLTVSASMFTNRKKYEMYENKKRQTDCFQILNAIATQSRIELTNGANRKTAYRK